MRFPQTTRQLNFLITAGGTREYIDPVRFISNASTGKMGYKLAKAAKAAGHNVTLITTIRNTNYDTQRSGEPASQIRNTKTVFVDTADEMFEAVKKHFPKCDCLIMAAAVSDYTPVKTSRLKIRKSSRYITLKLKPTPDILKWAGSHKHREQVVIGFALEDRNLKTNAEHKLRDKNLDIIVANRPQSIGADKSTVWIKPAVGKWSSLEKKSKSAIAQAVIRMAQTAFLGSSPK
jgi:phosphopantothenoylcysteine decarboxylase/phosphopantothenate--cysteine ligase